VKELINDRVHNYYWNEDLNCAVTTLRILSELFHTEVNAQVVEAAIGMNGAGRSGAQCGLVEGTLMFIGIYGAQKGLSKDEIVKLCYEFAKAFQQRFKSLACKELRPNGFNADDPPHLCEGKTKIAISFSEDFILKAMK